MTVRKATALATNLPPGAAVYRAEGSDESMSEEWHLLRLMEFRLRALEFHQGQDKGEKPQILPTPGEVTAKRGQEEQRQARADAARDRHIARMKERKAGGS